MFRRPSSYGKPGKGFEILVNSLNPNGIIKVGLYSSIARSTINKAREFIKIKILNFQSKT